MRLNVRTPQKKVRLDAKTEAALEKGSIIVASVKQLLFL